VGNEGGLDAAVFLFRWSRRGDRGGGARPAGGSAARSASVREEEERWPVGHAGGLDRPKGRGLVETGGKIDREKKRKTRPKGQMG
jgi:hypothetical protein